MRPYEVEIFDKDFNLKYHALIDAKEFSYSEDALDPEKNRVTVPSSFVPTGVNAPKGWFIRIFRPGEEYQGIISAFESGGYENTVTYSQLITLLNLELLVPVGDLEITTVEAYIKKLVTAEFINSNDHDQNICGLSEVVTTSSTFGTLPYTDTDKDKEYVTVNILDDIVCPAFDLYSIVTRITFDAQQKKVYMTVGTNAANTKMIEADLPNVIESSFTIQKYSKQVNKADCYDTYTSPPGRLSFYLHNSGAWDDDSESDRILPVVNSIMMLDGWSVAKSIIDAQLAAQNERLIELNELTRRLTEEEKRELDALAAKFMPLYVSQHQLSAPSVSGSDKNGVSIGVTSYATDRYFDEYAYEAVWIDDLDLNARLNVSYRSYHKHILLQAKVTASRTLYSESGGAASMHVNTRSFTLGQPVTSQNIQSTLSLYKKTVNYESEIQSIYAETVADAMRRRAEATFAKNKYSNLIELTTLSDDAMIHPLDISIGQIVEVIHDGVVYNSLLSGREVKDGLVTLIFGTIRLELTKYLKGRY